MAARYARGATMPGTQSMRPETARRRAEWAQFGNIVIAEVLPPEEVRRATAQISERAGGSPGGAGSEQGFGVGRRRWWRVRERAFGGLHRELVDEVVHAVAAVALHPSERVLARVVQVDERLPQVLVRDRL